MQNTLFYNYPDGKTVKVVSQILTNSKLPKDFINSLILDKQNQPDGKEQKVPFTNS